MEAARPLKVALVGCGSISGTWFQAMAGIPALETVALVDIHPAAARQRASEFGLEHALIETDLERALAQTRPDLVFDCTVPANHLTATLAALRHGCHVLGEKPLADSMESARRAVAAAQEAGRLYAVTQSRRYEPNIRRLKAFLDTGALGRLTALYCDFFIGAHFGGFREEMDHVLLLDMAIHHFDAARFLLGGAEARGVICHDWNPPGSWYRHGAAATATFEMADGSAFGYRGSWCAEGVPTSWQGSWRVVGERGSVLWDGESVFAAEVAASNEGFLRSRQTVEVPAGDFSAQGRGHASVISEFVAAVQRGTIPETVCTDNIKSLAMVFGAIESAERGQRVAMPV